MPLGNFFLSLCLLLCLMPLLGYSLLKECQRQHPNAPVGDINTSAAWSAAHSENTPLQNAKDSSDSPLYAIILLCKRGFRIINHRYSMTDTFYVNLDIKYEAKWDIACLPQMKNNSIYTRRGVTIFDQLKFQSSLPPTLDGPSVPRSNPHRQCNPTLPITLTLCHSVDAMASALMQRRQLAPSRWR